MMRIVKFVIPRVECFLEVFNQIDEIKNEDLIKKDRDLYDRYFFHSKSSLYGAVKFLNKDINKGLDELQKIYPDFDEEILHYKETEDNEIISKSKEILSSTVRTYLNKILNQNAERFIDHKNSSAYHGLEKMIDSSLPIDSEKRLMKKVTKEIKNLSIDEKEYLNRIVTATITYAKLQNWNLFISKTINQLSKIDISIDYELELEDEKISEIEDDWEKTNITENGNSYFLIKRNNGIKIHVKIFVDEKLDRFDIIKDKEELEKAEKGFIQIVNEVDNGNSDKIRGDKTNEELEFYITSLFWRIYNSYDNHLNISPHVFNMYAYFMYYQIRLKKGFILQKLHLILKIIVLFQILWEKGILILKNMRWHFPATVKQLI